MVWLLCLDLATWLRPSMMFMEAKVCVPVQVQRPQPQRLPGEKQLQEQV